MTFHKHKNNDTKLNEMVMVMNMLNKSKPESIRTSVDFTKKQNTNFSTTKRSSPISLSSSDPYNV